MKDIAVITLDGPSGSGKGTISRRLAKKLKWHFLDSGLIYRALGYVILSSQIDLNNKDSVINMARNLPWHFDDREVGEMQKIIFNQQDITENLQNNECAEAASKIAVIPKVRAALVDVQRNFKKSPGLIADGRDMGTQIFKEAPLKLFITASATERARRRYNQLKESGINVRLEQVQNEITNRDERDKTRKYAPMLPASDAILIDTTNKTIEEVISLILNYVESRNLNESRI